MAHKLCCFPHRKQFLRLQKRTETIRWIFVAFLLSAVRRLLLFANIRPFSCNFTRPYALSKLCNKCPRELMKEKFSLAKLIKLTRKSSETRQNAALQRIGNEQSETYYDFHCVQLKVNDYKRNESESNETFHIFTLCRPPKLIGFVWRRNRCLEHPAAGIEMLGNVSQQALRRKTPIFPNEMDKKFRAK